MKRLPPSAKQDTHPASDQLKVVPFRLASVPAPGSRIGKSDKLAALLDRLLTRQLELILAAAEFDMLPPHSVIRQIAELEKAIAAVANVMGDETTPRR